MKKTKTRINSISNKSIYFYCFLLLPLLLMIIAFFVEQQMNQAGFEGNFYLHTRRSPGNRSGRLLVISTLVLASAPIGLFQCYKLKRNRIILLWLLIILLSLILFTLTLNDILYFYK